MKVLGVITARGGSKGLPGKNLRPLAGKPLIAHTIDAARESRAFDRVILSTDDEAIAGAARTRGCDVPFMRPDELARDETPHLPVLQHAVAWLRDHEGYTPDAVMILQPTSPLRRAVDIVESIALLERSGADSVVSVSEVPAHYNPMRTLRIDAHGFASLFVTGEPVRRRINRRQDMPAAWTMNGAIYLFRTAALHDGEPSLYGARTAAYVMPAAVSVSIDSLDDWHDAERALAHPAPPRG
ncbi:MAG TPA: acylneuraminate cytidylyltransferase family protein [Vicinamibacterales bacterium]|nr:acylneuraminate cytidylyltransferase family protein [Vicinamibacterales bacterium]